MKKAVIIVAGGSGNRMKSDIPKQFLLLKGKPILMHTIERFFQFDKDIQITLVLPANALSLWKDLCQTYNFAIHHSVTHGGATRFESVRNGLNLINDVDIVAVHDGVRPFVSLGVLESCFSMAISKKAVIPVISPNDSIRIISQDGNHSIDRSTIAIVQTPQVFDFKTIKSAYKQGYNELFTDDASVVESYGQAITFCKGNVENIKITTPMDLLIAELIVDTAS